MIYLFPRLRGCWAIGKSVHLRTHSSAGPEKRLERHAYGLLQGPHRQSLPPGADVEVEKSEASATAPKDNIARTVRPRLSMRLPPPRKGAVPITIPRPPTPRWSGPFFRGAFSQDPTLSGPISNKFTLWGRVGLRLVGTPALRQRRSRSPDNSAQFREARCFP